MHVHSIGHHTPCIHYMCCMHVVLPEVVPRKAVLSHAAPVSARRVRHYFLGYSRGI